MKLHLGIKETSLLRTLSLSEDKCIRKYVVVSKFFTFDLCSGATAGEAGHERHV